MEKYLEFHRTKVQFITYICIKQTHVYTHTWPPPLTGGRAGGSSLLQRSSPACSWVMHKWHRTRTGSVVEADQHLAWPCWSAIGRRSSRTRSSPAPCKDMTHTGSWRRPWSWHPWSVPCNTPQGRSGGEHITAILRSAQAVTWCTMTKRLTAMIRMMCTHCEAGDENATSDEYFIWYGLTVQIRIGDAGVPAHEAPSVRTHCLQLTCEERDRGCTGGGGGGGGW